MSTDIRFYHLQTSTLDQALPQILTKALSANYRVWVKTSDEKEAERLADWLWTFRADSFLPHGTAKDGAAEDQPIWISSSETNDNNANLLVLTNGTTHEDVAPFDMCCEMLNGRSEEQVTAARARWTTYKDQGHAVTYWYQNDQGAWQKKA